MIAHFHFCESIPAKKADLHSFITLEETMDLPSAEEVDALSDVLISECPETLRLEAAGIEILDRLYGTEQSSATREVKCKGVIRDECRI
ncbi:hypothetical protein NEHOM01_2458 [Nematocida homosporus]|uniref:uncharacterized protein n=1 Tax=Nematocida homosporus TaxID=1912981 RepID=UPI00221F8EAB|nr:uncharacterized protein NEHOM01_2458 [Nematocida homosporus]KAI5187941.1 hypothetical protein NEHOM01_2458 [Nematocida homosporus]